MAGTHRLDEVLEARLCSGCGACAYVGQDHGVTMVDVPFVGRRPAGVPALPLHIKDQIADVCPGSQVNAPTWDGHSPDESELLVGPAKEIWEGWAADEALRWRGSSGGVVTALAAFALDRLHFGLVVHTGMDPDEPWRTRTVVSRTREELMAHSGSRYTTSSPVEALRMIEASDRPCVFIGKPCDVAAVVGLRRNRPDLDRNLGLVLSFFCAGTPPPEATQALASDLGVDPSVPIRSINYRGRGWPGDFEVADDDGVAARVSYEESWAQLARTSRQLRCHVCPDGLGELADVTGGDAWHRAGEGTDGISVILARTDTGQRIVEGAIREGYLEATPSDAARVVSAQRLVHRRRIVGARLLAMRTLLRPTPRYSGFKLGAAARQTSWREQLRQYSGMLRRLVVRGYLRPPAKSGGRDA